MGAIPRKWSGEKRRLKQLKRESIGGFGCLASCARFTHQFRRFLEQKFLERLCRFGEPFLAAVHHIPVTLDGEALYIKHFKPFRFQLQFDGVK